MTTRSSKAFSTTSLYAIALLGMAGSVVYAHPGHGLHEASPTHLLTSPFHLLTMALMGAALFFVARWISNRPVRQVARCAGATMVIASAAIFGLGM